MPGTFVQDSLAPDILAGATLNAAGTTDGTAVDLSAEGVDTLWKLDTATVSSNATPGNDATLTVHIYGAVDQAMTDKTRVGSFVITGTDAAQSNQEFEFDSMLDTYERWIQAEVIVGGTDPDYTGTTLKPHTKHFRRTKTDTAGPAT